MGTEIQRSRPLRTALWQNALFSGVFGTLFILAPELVSDYLGGITLLSDLDRAIYGLPDPIPTNCSGDSHQQYICKAMIQSVLKSYVISWPLSTS